MIHLSTSGDADGSVAILVAGTRSTDLGAGVSSFLSPDAVVIAAPAGVYQLILQVDALGNVDEDDEGDNILVAGEVTVTPSGDPEGDCTDGVDDDFDGLVDCADDDCAGIPYCDPDIVGVEVTGTSLPTVVSQGGTVSLGYGYANMGGGTTTGLSPGQPMVNHVLLSSSTSLLDAVQTLRVGERTSDIDAGDDGFLSPIDVTVSVSAGTYQVLLNVDVTDVVDEGDESNNVLVAGSLTVTAL